MIKKLIVDLNTQNYHQTLDHKHFKPINSYN